jgi:hypothetical protein
MGQRILAIHRDRLLEVLRTLPGPPIPKDATVTGLDYMPLTQDVILTIASQTFTERCGYLQTHQQW